MLGFTSVASDEPVRGGGAREAIERELRALGVNTTAAGQAGAVVYGDVFGKYSRFGVGGGDPAWRGTRGGDGGAAQAARAGEHDIHRDRQETHARRGRAHTRPRSVRARTASARRRSGLLLRKLGRGMAAQVERAHSVSRPWPRDLRGRLTVQGDAYQAYLPGLTCNGNAGGGMSITCREASLWPIGDGSAHARLCAVHARAQLLRRPRDRSQRIGRRTCRRFSPPPSFSGESASGGRSPAWMGRRICTTRRSRTAAPGQHGEAASRELESDCGARSQVLATAPGDDTVTGFRTRLRHR